MTVDKLTGVNEALAYNTRMVDQSNINWTGAPLLRAARTWLDEHQAKYEIPGSKAYSGETSTCVIRNGAQVKFWADGDTGEKQMCQYPFMRATEMYLYEAEACAELGRTTEAQALLEAVNTPHNPTYKCTASGQALIDEVRLYRRIELWGEGFSYYDIMRFQKGIDRRGGGFDPILVYVVAPDDPVLLFEIILDEAQNNPLIGVVSNGAVKPNAVVDTE